MKRVIPLSLLAMLLAVPVFAQVPQTMSYQGVLTDNTGTLVTDGNYNFVFAIYNVASGGAALWTETQNTIPVAHGGFSVLLGAVTPLTIAFDQQYWLGVAVNGAAEMTPRVKLGSSPYALSLRLPFSAVLSSASPLLDLKNSNATAPDLHIDHRLMVGPTPSGGISPGIWATSTGATTPYFNTFADVGFGGQMNLNNADATAGIRFQTAAGNSVASDIWLWRPESGRYMFISNDLDYIGSPGIYMQGASSIIKLSMGETGDQAVQLPYGSVNSSETSEEPGIAEQHTAGSVGITSSSQVALSDIVAVTILPPNAGYIDVTAEAQMGMGTNAIVGLQISDVSGAPLDQGHYFYVGGTGSPPYLPASVHRTFYVGCCTSYTFYFQAYSAVGAGSYAWNPTITAKYYSTGYGGVVTAVAAREASQFAKSTPVTVSGNGSGEPSVTRYVVDLRELELKAAKTRADAEKAQNELLQARLARMSPAIHAAAAPPKN